MASKKGSNLGHCLENIFVVVTQIFACLAIGSSFRLAPFCIPPLFFSFSSSLFSGTIRCPRLILCFPCSRKLSQPQNCPFHQGSLVPLIGEWYLQSKIWVQNVEISSQKYGQLIFYTDAKTAQWRNSNLFKSIGTVDHMQKTMNLNHIFCKNKLKMHHIYI